MKKINDEARFGPEPLKKGTWVAYEYGIWMLKEDESDPKRMDTTNIGNGVIETWVNVRERCFPLTLRSKSICNFFEHYRSDLGRRVKNSHLNWPDIHRYYCELFRGAIQSGTVDNLVAIQNKLRDFNEAIIDRVSAVGEVDGIQVFR